MMGDILFNDVLRVAKALCEAENEVWDEAPRASRDRWIIEATNLAKADSDEVGAASLRLELMRAKTSREWWKKQAEQMSVEIEHFKGEIQLRGMKTREDKGDSAEFWQGCAEKAQKRIEELESALTRTIGALTRTIGALTDARTQADEVLKVLIPEAMLALPSEYSADEMQIVDVDTWVQGLEDARAAIRLARNKLYDAVKGRGTP